MPKPLHITPYVSYVSTSISFGPRGERIVADSSAQIRFTNADGGRIDLPAMDHEGDLFSCSVIVVTFPEGSLPRVGHHDTESVIRQIIGDQSRWIAMARDAIAQHLDRQAVAS